MLDKTIKPYVVLLLDQQDVVGVMTWYETRAQAQQRANKLVSLDYRAYVVKVLTVTSKTEVLSTYDVSEEGRL